MKTVTRLFSELDLRRKELGMPTHILAKHSGVSLPTVNRVLSGEHEKVNWEAVRSIAEALGMTFELRSVVDPEDLREEQARKKAQKLMKMVQGTAALEAQAIDSTRYEQMMRRSIHELLAGPKRKLWSE